MLSDFTWNMTGYIPKHQVNPHGDGIIPYVAERIFQLEPEPPKVGSLNEYILSALQEKNLIHFSFFLHHYEPQLNKRIKDFLGVDGGDLYDTDRFIDIKLSCREQMLQKLMDYDLTKGAEYATYIYPFIRDAMLRFRMGEEKWSVSSLTNYKMVRSMAWLYHNTKDAVNEFSKKYNCDLALAEDYALPNQLSGGQQQRVAIARALAAAPAIILADEPTGNLDSKTSQDVLSLLKVTSQKFAQTIVMITHNEEIAQMADRIIRIEDGRIVSQN
ncbi:MAG: ATP-binding cassette domain-containing protein [Faecalibacterium sp.]